MTARLYFQRCSLCLGPGMLVIKGCKGGGPVWMWQSWAGAGGSA